MLEHEHLAQNSMIVLVCPDTVQTSCQIPFVATIVEERIMPPLRKLEVTSNWYLLLDLV